MQEAGTQLAGVEVSALARFEGAARPCLSGSVIKHAQSQQLNQLPLLCVEHFQSDCYCLCRRLQKAQKYLISVNTQLRMDEQTLSPGCSRNARTQTCSQGSSRPHHLRR